jgi:WD40 repeat protein
VKAEDDLPPREGEVRGRTRRGFALGLVVGFGLVLVVAGGGIGYWVWTGRPGAATEPKVRRVTDSHTAPTTDAAPSKPPAGTERPRADRAPRPKPPPGGGTLVRTFPAGVPGGPLTQRVTNLAVTPDGKRLVTANARGLRVWDTAKGDQEGVFAQHGSEDTWGLAIDSKGQRALSASDNGKMFLWDLATREALPIAFADVGPVRSVAISHDEKRAASGTYNNMLYLWDLTTGRATAPLNGRQGEVCALAFSADDRHLLSAGSDGTMRLWDVAAGTQRHTFAGHAGRVAGAAFSPDGRWIVSGGDDRTIRLWPASGEGEPRVLQGHEAAVTSVAFSADGRRLISGSAAPERAVCVWDVAAGQAVLRLADQGSGDVLKVAFAPDGRHAFAAGEDGAVRMWLLPDGFGKE